MQITCSALNLEQYLFTLKETPALCLSFGAAEFEFWALGISGVKNEGLQAASHKETKAQSLQVSTEGSLQDATARGTI